MFENGFYIFDFGDQEQTTPKQETQNTIDVEKLRQLLLLGLIIYLLMKV